MRTRALRFRVGITLTDLCVVIAALVLLLGALPAVCMNARETGFRTKCKANLRSIGQALEIYARQDRDSAFPRTYFDPADPTPTKYTEVTASNSFTPGGVAPNDVTACLFLLLKTTQVAPEYFICPSSNAIKYAGNISLSSNFPSGQFLSYSLANPFPGPAALKDGFRWDASLDSEHPVASDMNPGSAALVALMPTMTAAQMQQANSFNHDRTGQNVLYGDGHVAWASSPFCGVPLPGLAIAMQDNIFTSDTAPPTVGGTPQHKRDSVMLPLAGPGAQPPPDRFIPEPLIVPALILMTVIFSLLFYSLLRHIRQRGKP